MNILRRLCSLVSRIRKNERPNQKVLLIVLISDLSFQTLRLLRIIPSHQHLLRSYDLIPRRSMELSTPMSSSEMLGRSMSRETLSTSRRTCGCQMDDPVPPVHQMLVVPCQPSGIQAVARRLSTDFPWMEHDPNMPIPLL